MLNPLKPSTILWKLFVYFEVFSMHIWTVIIVIMRKNLKREPETKTYLQKITKNGTFKVKKPHKSGWKKSISVSLRLLKNHIKLQVSRKNQKEAKVLF